MTKLIFILEGFVALVVLLYPLRKVRLKLLIISPLLICLLYLGYWHWGAWPQWQDHVRREEILQKIKNPAELIAKLRSKLKEDSRSTRGWYLLGRLYASQGQWPEAVNAFLMAHRLNPREDQPYALVILAKDAYKNRHYEEARGYWQQLLRLVPQESKEAKMIKQAIAKT